MTDHCWTVIINGDTFQAYARGRGPGFPGLTETRALGAPRATRTAAEADGWACGLPPDRDYTPVTTRPAPVPVFPARFRNPPDPPQVMTAVPEPVLVPAPTAPTVPTPRPQPAPPEPEPEPEPEPRPAARRPAPRKGR